jgi:hypothetical protein
VQPRHPSSNFFLVLRSVFGYAPDMIEQPLEQPLDLDEFVLISSSGAAPHSVVKVATQTHEQTEYYLMYM